MMNRILSLIVVATFLVSALPANAGSRSYERPVSDLPEWAPWAFALGIAFVGATYLVSRAGVTREPLTPQERTIDFVRFIASPEEIDEIRKIESEEDLAAWMDRFFSKKDPSPGTAENEFLDAHRERYRYARRLCRGQTTDSDRARIAILYGPPDHISRCDMQSDVMQRATFGPFEFWQYDRAAGGNSIPPCLGDPGLWAMVFHSEPLDPGKMTFVFAERPQSGSICQVFSTEKGESIDSRLFDVTAP